MPLRPWVNLVMKSLVDMRINRYIQVPEQRVKLMVRYQTIRVGRKE